MKKLLTFLLANFIVLNFVFSQGAAINTSGAAPDPSALLDISGTSGLLIPRMSTSVRNAISSPANGLMVWNTSTNCLDVYVVNSWQSLICGCSAAPATPGSITGIASVCSNSAGYTYSVTPVVSATSYTWTVPAGAFITSGQGTPAINVTFGSSPGDVTVTAGNNCGVSPASILPVTIAGGGSGNQTFNYTGAQQTFIVPSCISSITIDAYGAQGGFGGGAGARVKGTFAVNPGDSLKILVGQQGLIGGSSNHGSGGGGSFVWVKATGTLLVAAGGGGGNCFNGAGGAGSATATPSPGGGSGSGTGGTSGSGGAGGAPSSFNYGTGGGGAGWVSNGGAGTGGLEQGGGGFTPLNGGAGGAAGGSGGVVGGFGGGGGSAQSYGAAGGGGGYNGGGGGNDWNGSAWGAGGGGGSFNNGTNQTNTGGVQTGNGLITITW